MGTPNKHQTPDRSAALRFANQALGALDALHGDWILWEATRPAARILKPVNEHLRRLTTMLDDAAADHYLVAHDLGVIFAQLMVMNDESLLKPLTDIASARENLLGQ